MNLRRSSLAICVALTAIACSQPSRTPPPRTPVFGCIGQSNMLGLGSIDQHPALPSLRGIHLLQPDLFAARDDVGVFTALDFAPSRYDAPSGPFDYPVNAGVPPRFASIRLFGPELHIGAALRDARGGGDVHLVKLAVGGVGLTVQQPWPIGLPSGWMWHTHDSWDPRLPRSVAPFQAEPRGDGTATAVTATSLTDAKGAWRADEHRGHWLVCGAHSALVTGNSPTTLQFDTWLPDAVGPPATQRSYRLETRTFFHASLARSFAEGYLHAADKATPNGIDYRGTFIAQGETDALREASARDARRAMGELIAYLRRTIVAQGLTTQPAEQLPFVLALVKETDVWPFAGIVNDGYRELAAADPRIRLVDASDVELGGFDGADRAHYGAKGQIRLGTAMAEAMLALRPFEQGPRRD